MSPLLTKLLGLLIIILGIVGLSSLSTKTKTLNTPLSYDRTATTSIKTNTTTTSKNVPATTSPSTTKPITVKKPTATPTTQTIQIPVATPLPQAMSSSTAEVNTEVRKSLVNILCMTTFNPLKAITGTGVIIDPRGIILTNAHVAQYYLLKNYAGPNSIDCFIRTGSPAVEKYRAELLFISPLWVEENKNNLKEENPLGTGENDFALLLITKNVTGTPLTDTFQALDIETSDSNIDRKQSIDHVVAGYPAGFLGISAVERDLYTASAVARIQEIFTFDTTTVDLMAVGGNVVAQKGASGGAVVSTKDKKLVGLIVTTTDAKTTGERDLRAITLSHVERSLRTSTGKGIKEYVSGNVNETLRAFQDSTFVYLAGILKNVLQTH